MSWSRVASRTTGRVAGAASTARSVWSQRSSPGTLFWGIPRWAARSGEIARSRSVSLISRRPTDGTGAASSLSSSAAIRSPDRWRASSARAWIPARVAGSTPNPSVAASRTARIIRRASSSKRVRASPTARNKRASVSASPSNGSRKRRRPPGSDPPGHRVDREVAAGQVQLDAVAELDPVRSPEVGVVVIRPERRDLEDLVVVADGDRAEPVLVDGVREERDDRLGQRPRREVPVLAAGDPGRGRATSRRRRTRRDRSPRGSGARR